MVEEISAVERQTMVEEISAVERQTMVEEISAVVRQTMVEEISAVERQTMVEEISAVERQTMVEEISAVERQTMVEEISAVERQTMVEEISAVERQTMVEEISSCASNNVDLPSVTKATLLNPRARSSGRRQVFVNPFTKGRRSWMKIRLQRCWDDVHQLIRPQKMGRIGPVKHWNKVVLTPTLDTILEEETPEEAEQARKTEKDDRYFLLAEDDTCWSTFLYCLRLLWESFGIC
ncbi:hypothetical protein DPEC_G00229280 [Dallia pectoralis]|uniref:Uncharacterized protein n=1 Tax=Dallia pectoralis TaxID=75939 RepID=A0ACC2G157_DALPE|nr:hypothetical protein DPEC_G00229280 [Dallia pectoralis]